MRMTTSCAAIRMDGGLTAAHGGTALSSRTRFTAATNVATKATNGAPKAAFVGVPAYVADQESHPPRGSSPV